MPYIKANWKEVNRLKTGAKKFWKVLLITLIIFIILLLTILIIRYIHKKRLIQKVSKMYISNIEIENEEENDENLIFEIDGKTVIGVLKIDKINFEGLVYEGTDDKTLKQGVGHFENTSVLEGNPCFAAHNYRAYWSKLHTLENGDTISYISYIGTKDYEVFRVQEIDDTDWSLLQNTDSNIITLITCINHKPEKRLCVQAKEKNLKLFLSEPQKGIKI